MTNNFNTQANLDIRHRTQTRCLLTKGEKYMTARQPCTSIHSSLLCVRVASVVPLFPTMTCAWRLSNRATTASETCYKYLYRAIRAGNYSVKTRTANPARNSAGVSYPSQTLLLADTTDIGDNPAKCYAPFEKAGVIVSQVARDTHATTKNSNFF